MPIEKTTTGEDVPLSATLRLLAGQAHRVLHRHADRPPEQALPELHALSRQIARFRRRLQGLRPETDLHRWADNLQSRVDALRRPEDSRQ